MTPGESALIVPVPEADPIVDSWRQELDPGRHIGAPAHITLLFPFAPPDHITPDLVARIGSVASGFAAFDFSLESVQWFGSRVVYLAPSRPERFVMMTEAFQAAFPEYPRYEGVHPEIVPHVTLGEEGDPARMRAAAEAVGPQLPISASARCVDLLAGTRDADSWRLIHRFAL